jgi:hypothetical protein
MKQFEIFFHDLTPNAKGRLLEAFQTTMEDENWENAPLAIFEREDASDVHANAHVSVRVLEWREFSKYMESYIAEHTLDKYGFPSQVDLMEISKILPVVNIWNVLKYALRIWNCHGKEFDVEKAGHYIQRYWTLTRDLHSASSQSCPQ